MKRIALSLIALAALAACAEAREVVVQKTVVRDGFFGRRNDVRVEKVVVQQQNAHHHQQQLNIVAVPVQSYAAPVQQFSACQQNFQSYSQPVVVERVVVQQQNHCQKFFRR